MRFSALSSDYNCCAMINARLFSILLKKLLLIRIEVDSEGHLQSPAAYCFENQRRKAVMAPVGNSRFVARKSGSNNFDLLEESAEVSEDAWNQEKLAWLRANVIMLGLSTRAISTLPSITSKEQGRAAGGLRRLCLLLAVDRLSSTSGLLFAVANFPPRLPNS